MFKFIGKTLVLGALSAGAIGCLYGKDQLASWFHRGKQELAAKIDEMQGMTGELRGIEGRVRSLENEIKDLKRHAIEEEVEVQRIDGEAAGRKQSLERLKKGLEKAQTLLAAAGDRFLIGGASYSRNDVERDVAEKLDLYQVQQETLAQLEQTLAVHRSALAIAKENVTRGEALRNEMTGNVRLLQAKLEKHRAREIYADAVAADFDTAELTTEIGAVRQEFAKFESKLEVKSRLLDERMKLAAGTKAAGIDYDAPDQPQTGDLCERLSKLLGRQPEATTSVVIVRHE